MREGVGYGREGGDMGGRGWNTGWRGEIREGGVGYGRVWDMGGRGVGYGREGIWDMGGRGVGYGRDGGWDDSHTPLLFMVFGLPLGTSAHSKWPISSKSMIQ